MKISIITVCYNSERTIEDTLLSVLSQDHPEVEFIIIDGGSDDGTLDIIRKYTSSIHLLISEKDKGIYFALNKGVELATGDVVGILHSDDFYTSPSVLSKICRAFEENGSDAVYGNLQYVSRDNPDNILRNWISGPYTEGLFLKGWMPPHPAFFIQRKCYELYGTFNTSFHSAADYELMLRMIQRYHIRLTYLPEVLVKMRIGGKSNVSLINRLKANREDRKAWRINNLQPGPFTLIFKPLSKLRQFFS
jgi:glycosyltransferase involved in cell wall biosynthesis